MKKITARIILPPMEVFPGRRYQIIQTRRLRTLLVAAAIMCGAVHAQNAHETACQHVGTLASAVAQARDDGLSQTAAVATVQARATPAEQPFLVEAAKLLYARFRQMPAESAALEFMLDCLDSAD